MSTLEIEMLEYLGEQEFTDFEMLAERFDADELTDISQTLDTLIQKGFAKEVVVEGYTYSTRTMNGYMALNPHTELDDGEIPF